MAAAAVLAGCGPTPPTSSPSASPTASASASGSPTASASSVAIASPAPSAVVSPSAAEPSGPPLPAGVTVDPGLLEVLPTLIDGVALQPDPDTAAEVASDPLLAESALSIAVALAVASEASDGEDVAVASVIRLRPDVFDEAFYQQWRESYDEAACAVAGGLETELQTEIAGRPTYVGTCGGGAMTYHTFLIDQGFLVSITATGERRFGELILDAVAG
jgi:hypothetical protein